LLKKNYPDSKADLMACFIEQGLNILQNKKGFLGMINHSWMFFSSYGYEETGHRFLLILIYI
jgi:hypothetical protein